jgi:hypothetical protein
MLQVGKWATLGFSMAIASCSSTNGTKTNSEAGNSSVGGVTWQGGGSSVSGSGQGGNAVSTSGSATGGALSTGGVPSTTGTLASTGGNAPIGGSASIGGGNAPIGGSTLIGGNAATGGTAPIGGSTLIGGSAATGAGASTGGSASIGGGTSVGAGASTGGLASTGGTTAIGSTLSTGGTNTTGGVSFTGGTSGIDPGAIVPIVVNSSNTATYNLGDSQQKLFSFPAQSGQLYCISGLGGIVHGYLGASASVSPTNFISQTDADGYIVFTASATQTYYLAVQVSGGGASGSFQVADGGTLLALGATSMTLTATQPNLDDYYFFRFPITAGKSYRIQVTGPNQPSVGLAVSKQPDRSTNGQFASSAWGVSGSLPIDEVIATTTNVVPTSGYYYFYVNVHGDMAMTITLTES